MKPKKLVAIALLIIVAIAGFFLYLQRDRLFVHVYKITYPDRCTETYENDVLVSEACTNGRLLYEESIKRKTPTADMQWNLNLS